MIANCGDSPGLVDARSRLTITALRLGADQWVVVCVRPELRLCFLGFFGFFCAAASAAGLPVASRSTRSRGARR